MATTRPFSYNTGTSISGTTQVGNLAVGFPTSGFTGMEWWNGPDEDLGYVIAQPVSGGNQPTNVPEDALSLSPTYKGTDISLSNNNQTASQVFSYSQTVLGETLISGSDKVMFSVKYTSTNPSVGIGGHFVGVGLTSMNYSGPFNGYPGNDTNSIGFSDDGQYYFNGSVVQSGLPTWTTGDIIDITISHGQGWFIRVNGGDWNNNPSADPITLNGYLPMNGLTNFYPALCPYIYGTMEVLNYPKYGVPSTYNFLGNVTASVGFFRTSGFNDSEFIDIANILLNENYINAPDASTGLTSNGYWNSYTTIITSGLTLSLDAGNPLSYPGTGSTWTDTISGKTFTLFNSPTYSSNDGGYLLFTPASGQYAQSTSLPSSLSKWTVEVWHYYTATNSGSLPSIITELFPGVTSKINFNLGSVFTSPGGLESGFFDGSWRVTASYSLTANAWYYIVGTYDGATNKLYINNTLVSSTSFTGTPTSSQGGIRLMRRWDNPDYWGGRLGIVRIYNRSLSETEVTQNFNNNKSRFGL